MNDAPQTPEESIAELARTMTPERRGRFLDAACGGNLALREAVEARLKAMPAPPPPADEPSADAFETLAMDAVSAAEETEKEHTVEVEPAAPIAEHCDVKLLDPLARIRLFQQACRLVDADHRRGRIHGDIAPGSIRVGFEGDVRLDPPDTTDPDAADPRYASPEQIPRRAVTTATDVYGLGVVLYELLTGQYPYRTATAEPDRDELFQTISEQAPERPSQVIARQEAEAAARGEYISTLRQLRKLLDGDLDLIVLRALQKEPERRYRSAEDLAEDLDRGLAGRPVLAHPPGGGYVAGRFVRRHPIATTLGVLGLLGLVLGLAATGVALVRSRRATARAEAAARENREAIDRLFARVDGEPLLGNPDVKPARRALLEEFLRHFEEADAAPAPGGGLAARLEWARTRQRIGRIYERMGLSEVAAWQYAEALEAIDTLAKEPALPDLRDEQVELRASLGELLRAETGRRAEARSHLEGALALLEQAPRTQAQPSLPRRRLLARVLADLAELERVEGHPGPAADAWRRAVQVRREIASGTAATAEDRVALADALGGLGRTLAATPDTATAGLPPLTEAAELRQEVVRVFPDRADQAEALARTWRGLADLGRTLGQTGTAAEHARRAVEIYEQLDRRFPETEAYQTGLYLSYDTMARLLAQQNETKPALERSNQARAVLERLMARHPKDRIYPLDLARCHNLIGRLQQRRRAYPEALASFQQAVDLLESVPGLDGESSYLLGANLALGIGLLGATADAPPPDDEAALNAADRLRQQVYGKRAVAALEQAVARGLTAPEPYRTDTDLDSLRDRSDFQKLLKQLVGRAEHPDKKEP